MLSLRLFLLIEQVAEEKKKEIASFTTFAASAGFLRVVRRPHRLSVHYRQLHRRMGEVVEES